MASDCITVSARWWPLLGHRASWHKTSRGLLQVCVCLPCQAKVARVPVVCETGPGLTGLERRERSSLLGPKKSDRKFPEQTTRSSAPLRGPTDALRPLRTGVLLGSSLAVGSGQGPAERKLCRRRGSTSLHSVRCPDLLDTCWV